LQAPSHDEPEQQEQVVQGVMLPVMLLVLVLMSCPVEGKEGKRSEVK